MNDAVEYSTLFVWFSDSCFYLAYHLQNCDGSSEKPNMEAGKFQVNVAIVTNTVSNHFATSVTCFPLYTGSLKARSI